MVETVSAWLQRTLALSPALQERLLSSAIAILILWALRRLVLFVAYRRYDDVRIRYRWRKSSLYAAGAIGMLIVGRIWFEGAPAASFTFRKDACSPMRPRTTRWGFPSPPAAQGRVRMTTPAQL